MNRNPLRLSLQRSFTRIGNRSWWEFFRRDPDLNYGILIASNMFAGDESVPQTLKEYDKITGITFVLFVDALPR